MILRFTRQPDGFSHRLTIENDLGEMLISEVISGGKLAEIWQFLQTQCLHKEPQTLMIETAKKCQEFEGAAIINRYD